MTTRQREVDKAREVIAIQNQPYRIAGIPAESEGLLSKDASFPSHEDRVMRYQKEILSEHFERLWVIFGLDHPSLLSERAATFSRDSGILRTRS